MRDLIEAGLSEPADARVTYGISAITLVLGDRAWMIQCPHAGGDEAELWALIEAVDMPIGNLR